MPRGSRPQRLPKPLSWRLRRSVTLFGSSLIMFAAVYIGPGVPPRIRKVRFSSARIAFVLVVYLVAFVAAFAIIVLPVMFQSDVDQLT